MTVSVATRVGQQVAYWQVASWGDFATGVAIMLASVNATWILGVWMIRRDL